MLTVGFNRDPRAAHVDARRTVCEQLAPLRLYIRPAPGTLVILLIGGSNQNTLVIDLCRDGRREGGMGVDSLSSLFSPVPLATSPTPPLPRATISYDIDSSSISANIESLASQVHAVLYDSPRGLAVSPH